MNGASLKAARERLGLDQYTLAKILGVHTSTLYRWEQRARGFDATPLHEKILTQFVKWVQRTGKDHREIAADHMRRNAVDDPLYALYHLLGEILEGA